MRPRGCVGVPLPQRRSPPTHPLAEVTIQIPRSAVSRRQLTYAQLICKVHPDRKMRTAFEGVWVKPGSKVEYSALAGYPEKPLLIEYAGNDASGRGHNRSKDIRILWRFEPEKNNWVEIIRTLGHGSEWIADVMPIVLRELGGPPKADPEIAATVTRRFFSQLDVELGELAAADRTITLNLVFEQLVARLVSLES